MSSSKNNENQTLQSEVATWLTRESAQKQNTLEIASKHFDEKDAFDVHTLESIYARESSFGTNKRKPGSAGAAGDFQMEPKTAEEMDLETSKSNDERFDFDKAAPAAAKKFKKLDNQFSKQTTLLRGTKTIAIDDADERKKFALAAYNAGEGRIAKAQTLAKKAGDDPEKWEDVQKYLEKSGATKDKAKEIREYVSDINECEKEFSKQSKANPKAKFDKIKQIPMGSHWITYDGRHILIKG